MEARVEVLEDEMIIMASPRLGADPSTWSPFPIVDEDAAAGPTADDAVSVLEGVDIPAGDNLVVESGDAATGTLSENPSQCNGAGICRGDYEPTNDDGSHLH